MLASIMELCHHGTDQSIFQSVVNINKKYAPHSCSSRPINSLKLVSGTGHVTGARVRKLNYMRYVIWHIAAARGFTAIFCEHLSRDQFYTSLILIMRVL